MINPSSSFNIKRLFALLLLCFVSATALCAQANPFTTGARSEAPASVRVSRPIAQLAAWQTSLRDALADFFYRAREGADGRFSWMVLGLAFLYGILHALGPGHRKTIVFSLYLARSAPWWEPLGLGALLAFLHAGTTVVLMLFLKGASGALSGSSARIASLMEGIAYTSLLLMSLVLLANAVFNLVKSKSGHTHSHGGKKGQEALSTGALIISGLYPCPGAILVLILSLSLDMFGLGVAAVGTMSLGMSIPIIGSGYLAWLGRTGLFLRAKKNEAWIARLSSVVEFSGYAILFAFSLFIALPFILSLPTLF